MEAPDLDTVEPDLGDREDPAVSDEIGNLPQLLLSDHEDPAVSSEAGNLPQLLQPSSGAPSLHGSEDLDGIYEYDAVHDGEDDDASSDHAREISVHGTTLSRDIGS